MKKLKVLGPGCYKCQKLFDNTEAAAKDLGIEYEIEKVNDILEITGFGVMTTPALVIDGKVELTGKTPDVEEIKKLLS